MEIRQSIINIIPAVASILFLILIILLAKTYRPEEVIVKQYERINNRLREKKSSIINYERINNFLMANGADYHYGKWIDPIKYCAICILFSAGLLLITIRYHWIVALIGMIVGYKLSDWMLIYLNRKDNDKFLVQMQIVYNALSVQVKAGVYVSDALSECYVQLPDGRLRDAFEELSGELFVNNSFRDALESFNKKFNNDFINTLCIILIQGQESGRFVELLNDMAEQIKDMQSELLRKKKGTLDRTGTFCILGVLACFIVIILYALATTMFSMASNL